MHTKRRVIVLLFLLGLIALQLVSADHHKKNKKHRDHDDGDDDHDGKGGKGHHGDHEGKHGGKHHGGKHHGGGGHGCGDWTQKKICAGAVEKCFQFAKNETAAATQKTEIGACLKLEENLDDCAAEVNKNNEGCFMKCTQNCNSLTTFNNWATCLQNCDNCTNVTNSPYGFCEKYVDKCRKLAGQQQGAQNQTFANEVCNQINVTSCNQKVAEGKRHCYKKCGHKCYKHHSDDFIQWNVCHGYCHVKCADDDEEEDNGVWDNKDHDNDHDDEDEDEDDDDEEDGERRRKKHKGGKKHKGKEQKKHKKNKQKKHKKGKEQKKHKKNQQNKGNKKHDNNKNHHKIQAPVPAPTTDHVHRRSWIQNLPH